MSTIIDALTLGASIIFSLGGGSAIVIAASSWLGKVWANRILEQDRARFHQQTEKVLESIRGDREKGVFVHKIQFEAEFNAYKIIWQTLGNAISSALALRPMLDNMPVDKTPEQVRQERLESYSLSFRQLQEAVRNNMPFIIASLDEPLNEIMGRLHDEAVEYKYGDHRKDVNEEYWTNQEINAEDIQNKAKKISELIRERIGLLVIIDDSGSTEISTQR